MQTWLKTFGVLAVCAAITAAALPVAIVAWQSRADLRGAVAGFRLTADRVAELVGDTDVDGRGERFTVARLVKTSDGTVLLVRPVLRESATTVAEARKPLSEAARTIRAARPALRSAKAAVDAIPPAVGAGKDAVVELRGKAGPVLDSAAGITAQIEQTLPVFTDCEQNPSCLENRWRGWSWNAEKTTRAVASAAPTVAQNVEAITADTRKIVHRAASPWSVVVDVLKKIKDFIF